MTIELFMFLFTVGSLASSLITQAIKKSMPKVPSNIAALICAGVVGILGTMAAYVLLGIAFDLKNLICIALMTACIWVGSMVGYDKVMQTISQYKRG